jgi:hypothetical protein
VNTFVGPTKLGEIGKGSETTEAVPKVEEWFLTRHHRFMFVNRPASFINNRGQFRAAMEHAFLDKTEEPLGLPLHNLRRAASAPLSSWWHTRRR